MIDIPKLVAKLGAMGHTASEIADVLSECMLVPAYAMEACTTPARSSRTDEQRQKDRERQAAKRARDAAAKSRDVTPVTPVTEENVTTSHADVTVTPSCARAPTCAQVVNSSLPSEEVITPLGEPSVLSPPVPKSRKPRTKKPKSRRCPESWEPNHTHRAIALEIGLSGERCRLELAKFRDYEFKTPHSDWDATFRNWLRNNAERTANGTSSRPGALSGRRASKLESLARGIEKNAARDRVQRWAGRD
jgi:hypothetical protein